MNDFIKNKNLLKLLTELSSSPCAGCLFFKVGICSIKDVYVHYNNLDEFPVKVDKCNLKITHEDFSNFVFNDYFECVSSGYEDSFLCILLDSILIKKKSMED